MQKIFIRYMSAVVIVALLAILAMNWGLQEFNARNRMMENSEMKLDQIVQTLENNEVELQNLKDSLSEDYLTRAYAFAYIIEQNPEVLGSQSELERIARLLNVDELHVIDENGILFAGSVPLYFGMDFHDTDQTREFLPILEDPDSYLVQDIRPNGYEQKVFQYIGVARKDQKGIVQVGMAPTRMLEAQKRNQLEYILSRMPLDSGTMLFTVDKDTQKVLIYYNERMDEYDLSEFGATPEALAGLSSGVFMEEGGQRIFYVTREYGNILLGMGKTSKALYKDRNLQLFLTMAFLIFACLIMISVINWLLKIKIVNGIHRITDDLSKITEGRLDTVVNVDNNPEFRLLSQRIYKMVQGILNATVRVSQVIDVVDMPIGVFEYGKDSREVMATDRLRLVLGWTEEEGKKLYQDKENFEKRLREILCRPAAGEKNVYQVSEKPEKWVRLQMNSDENGTFGIAADVTKDMQEKWKIQHERDYDSLTGLCNIDTFKKEVSLVLEQGNPGAAAMVMMDLDNFKGINDRYGHDWGDEYLRRCARILEKRNGERGIAARRSGDEFCLFLHHFSSREEIANYMEELYGEIRAGEITFPDGSTGFLRISSGLAWYGESLNSGSMLLRAADYALYDAKNNGKGIWKQYSL